MFLTFLCAPDEILRHVDVLFFAPGCYPPENARRSSSDCSLNANATLLLLLPCRFRSNVIDINSTRHIAHHVGGSAGPDDKFYSDTNTFQCSTTREPQSFRRPSHGAKKRRSHGMKHSSYKLRRSNYVASYAYYIYLIHLPPFCWVSYFSSETY